MTQDKGKILTFPAEVGMQATITKVGTNRYRIGGDIGVYLQAVRQYQAAHQKKKAP